MTSVQHTTPVAVARTSSRSSKFKFEIYSNS